MCTAARSHSLAVSKFRFLAPAHHIDKSVPSTHRKHVLCLSRLVGNRERITVRGGIIDEWQVLMKSAPSDRTCQEGRADSRVIMQTASDDQPLCRRTPLLLGGIVVAVLASKCSGVTIKCLCQLGDVGRGGPTPILRLNWFQTPIKSQNWQRSFEITPFRTISWLLTLLSTSATATQDKQLGLFTLR
jgi:hypothetical protein